MIFYLGTNNVAWLKRFDVPLMVSRRRIIKLKNLYPSVVSWTLDSGGFTELSMYGKWTVPAHQYIAEVRRYYDEIGNMVWAAGQDWMCEPWIIEKTGLTIDEHIARTVGNYIDLKTWAPDLPIIPTLQGWQMNDYLKCFDAYEKAGIDLRKEPTVGLGSVCRRQATNEIGHIVQTFAAEGLKLHGFGCKAGAVKKYGHLLYSADSTAWSFGGMYVRPCPIRGTATCCNCEHYALEWREKVLSAFAEPELTLFD